MKEKLYHCADTGSSENILKFGYKTKLDSEYFFNGLYEDHAVLQRGLIAMLADKDKNFFLDKELPLKNNDYEKLISLWLKEFSDGTILWVSTEPDHTYGEVCLEVSLPWDATKICEHQDLGTAYYSSETPISPNHFSLKS